MDGDGADEADIFSCRADNVKAIVEVLNSLSSGNKKDQICYVEATIEGKTKSSQARATLQADLFESYSCESESITFSVNLSLLLECLHLYGPPSDTVTVDLYYSTIDAIFKISLDEGGVLSVCDLATIFEDECDAHDLWGSFRNSEEEAQIIVKSEPLQGAIAELLEISGASSIGFKVLMDPDGIQLAAKGSLGACEIEFPRSSEAFVSFRCSRSSRWIYPITSFAQGMKALGVASETYLRVNAEGTMCIQHQVQTTSGLETYIDFLMLASTEDTED